MSEKSKKKAAPSSKTPRQKTTKEKSTAVVKKEKTSEVDIAAEQRELAKLKAEIHQLSDNFIQVVVDLTMIKKRQLWKYECRDDGQQKYETFEEFMDAEFGFKRSYFSRLKAAYMGYNWLKAQDSQLQPQSFPRPLFYETLYRIPKDKRLDVLQEFMKGNQPLTASALTNTQETLFGSQDKSATPKEIEHKKLERTIKILFGMLKGIDLKGLKTFDLPVQSGEDLETFKMVLKLLNDKIQNGKTDKAD